MIKVTFEEALVIGTCTIHVQEKMGTQKYLSKSCYHRIECPTANFLATFMWRRPLNSTVLVTTTHRKPESVSNVTST